MGYRLANNSQGSWIAFHTNLSLATGEYEVEFEPLAGYITPDNNRVSIVPSSTTVTVGIYRKTPPDEPAEYYNVTVNITFQQNTNNILGLPEIPENPTCTVGATTVDSGVSTQFYNGRYTISFPSVSGYIAPSDIVIDLYGGNVITNAVYMVDFMSAKTLMVRCHDGNGNTIEGGAYSIVGLDEEGVTHLSDVAVYLYHGTYTIAFEDVTGYFTPSSQSVTISSGASAEVIGIYVKKQATLIVHLESGSDTYEGQCYTLKKNNVTKGNYAYEEKIDLYTTEEISAWTSIPADYWTVEPQGDSTYYIVPSGCSFTTDTYYRDIERTIDGYEATFTTLVVNIQNPTLTFDSEGEEVVDNRHDTHRLSLDEYNSTCSTTVALLPPNSNVTVSYNYGKHEYKTVLPDWIHTNIYRTSYKTTINKYLQSGTNTITIQIPNYVLVESHDESPSPAYKDGDNGWVYFYEINNSYQINNVTVSSKDDNGQAVYPIIYCGDLGRFYGFKVSDYTNGFTESQSEYDNIPIIHYGNIRISGEKLWGYETPSAVNLSLNSTKFVTYTTDFGEVGFYNVFVKETKDLIYTRIPNQIRLLSQTDDGVPVTVPGMSNLPNMYIVPSGGGFAGCVMASSFKSGLQNYQIGKKMTLPGATNAWVEVPNYIKPSDYTFSNLQPVIQSITQSGFANPLRDEYYQKVRLRVRLYITFNSYRYWWSYSMYSSTRFDVGVQCTSCPTPTGYNGDPKEEITSLCSGTDYEGIGGSQILYATVLRSSKRALEYTVTVTNPSWQAQTINGVAENTASITLSPYGFYPPSRMGEEAVEISIDLTYIYLHCRVNYPRWNAHYSTGEWYGKCPEWAAFRYVFNDDSTSGWQSIPTEALRLNTNNIKAIEFKPKDGYVTPGTIDLQNVYAGRIYYAYYTGNSNEVTISLGRTWKYLTSPCYFYPLSTWHDDVRMEGEEEIHDTYYTYEIKFGLYSDKYTFILNDNTQIVQEIDEDTTISAESSSSS